MRRPNNRDIMNILLRSCISFCLHACATVVVLGAQPVFPGAQGFGTDTPAGRGGRLLVVTNLAASGPGSLRAALAASGPRIVVFEVGGTIDLARESLRIDHPFLTLAGQTAPPPGITIVRGGLSIRTHDVLVQHLAIRPGDADQPKRSGWEPDGIGLSSARNVVIDHCSTTWAVDENLSASGPRHEGQTSARITFSHCLIAEGLDDSSHHWAPHSKGTLIHDRVQEVAIIACLYAHNADRNPYFKIGASGVVVNNLIYNPRDAALTLNWSEREWASRPPPPHPRVSVVGNVLLPGPDTKTQLALVGGRIGSAYLHDNRVEPTNSPAGPLVDETIHSIDQPPLWPVGLTAQPAATVFEYVLRNVGSRPANRHEIDRRIVSTVVTRTGRIIDSQKEVGGYPDDRATHRRLVIPGGDIEAWLHSFSMAVEPATVPAPNQAGPR